MVLILCLGIGITYYIKTENGKPTNPRTLRFTEVGSLNVDDPVRMEGTLIGQVSGFEHDSAGHVLVFIRSPKPIPIRTSSRVSVKVKGVMGERFIEISTGNLNDPLIDSDAVINGIFEMGPSEAVAYMDMLSDKIIELRDVMLWLRDGKEGSRSFIAAFSDIVEVIDGLASKILTELVGMEDGLASGLETAADIVDWALRTTAGIAIKAPELMDDLGSLMVKVDSLASKTERVFTQLSNIAEKVDGNNLLWGDHVEKIQGHLVIIRELMDDLRRDGLPLTVRPRFW
ncbi:MAG: MlaD family protein [Chitinispirillales bacterium]|jgi:hypothetical protein|nr:MlaD family protein [Chitinispirillales bacterium]